MELIVKELNLSYDDKILLENASLSLNSNRIQISGRNGVGKTTLLNALYNGSYDGTITINGKSLKNRKDNTNNISFISQYPVFVERADLKYHLKLLKLDVDDTLKEIQSYDSTITVDSKIAKLSGGQRQIINIVLGLKKQSKLLIIDEPYNNLSEKNCKLVEAAIESDERDIILVSHKPNSLNFDQVLIEMRDFVCQN